jgi:hypothetical protein
MSDAQLQRVAQAEWLRYAADVAETLTDGEIAALGQRLRTTTGEWLRQVAKAHAAGEDVVNFAAAEWVMRLLLEQRGFTLQGIQLQPRARGDD